MQILKTRPCRLDLLGRDAEDWETYFPIYGPLLPDSGHVISLSDCYFISMGAHAHHMTLLMNRDHSQSLTVEKSLNACALFTFITDSPVVPLHHDEFQHRLAAKNNEAFFASIKLAGFPAVESYFDSLSTVAEAVLPFANYASKRTNVMRMLPDHGREHWLYIEWPNSTSTWRALSAYWSAWLSISVPGRILNFWRSAEALYTKKQLAHVFSQLDVIDAQPVESSERVVIKGKSVTKCINSMVALKRIALARRLELIKIHGDANKALDWLYWERRGKAAHADKYSLEYDGLDSFADQLKDASLIQFMARHVIEHSWQ